MFDSAQNVMRISRGCVARLTTFHSLWLLVLLCLHATRFLKTGKGSSLIVQASTSSSGQKKSPPYFLFCLRICGQFRDCFSQIEKSPLLKRDKVTAGSTFRRNKRHTKDLAWFKTLLSLFSRYSTLSQVLFSFWQKQADKSCWAERECFSSRSIDERGGKRREDFLGLERIETEKQSDLKEVEGNSLLEREERWRNGEREVGSNKDDTTGPGRKSLWSKENSETNKIAHTTFSLPQFFLLAQLPKSKDGCQTHNIWRDRKRVVNLRPVNKKKRKPICRHRFPFLSRFHHSITLDQSVCCRRVQLSSVVSATQVDPFPGKLAPDKRLSCPLGAQKWQSILFFQLAPPKTFEANRTFSMFGTRCFLYNPTSRFPFSFPPPSKAVNWILHWPTRPGVFSEGE